VESTDNSNIEDGCARRDKVEMIMLLDSDSKRDLEGKAIELKL
jgi:hypothetical protein